MYKINDYVVYKHDVCKIGQIKENYYQNHDYYLLLPIDSQSLKISVPTQSEDIRPIVSRNKVEEMITLMKDMDIVESTDKMIEKHYKNLLSTQKLEDLIKLVKTAYTRNRERIDNNKKISSKDDDYFQYAQRSLYNEFSIALDMSFDQTRQYVLTKLED